MLSTPQLVNSSTNENANANEDANEDEDENVDEDENNDRIFCGNIRFIYYH